MKDALSRTPLFERHRASGARFVPFAGYEMPVQYEGVVAEHQAVRNALGLFDVSHMGELWVEGDDAVDVVNRLITNDLGRITDGKGLYTCCCNDEGYILDDLIVYRVSPGRVLVVCNASNRSKIAAHFAERTKGRSVDKSDQTALIAVQGPKAMRTLELLSTGPSPFRRFEIQERELVGQRCWVARTGYTGEDGFELFCEGAAAPTLWDALLDAGRPLGAMPIGLAARDTLRLEARLALYGNDIDETTNPIEAGLAWTVKPDKADFVGKAALQRIRERGVTRTLVGFEMTGRGIARHGYPILDAAQEPIGICTSGAPSPTLGRNIGLGYVPIALSEPGTDLFVDCRGKSIAAKVVPTPFYKRD
jgi:aminomethyltransferase